MLEASHPLQTPSYLGLLSLRPLEKTDTRLIGREDPASQSVHSQAPPSIFFTVIDTQNHTKPLDGAIFKEFEYS